MNIYTPDLFPAMHRRLPHDEGASRLAAIRISVEAMPEPATDSIAAETARLKAEHRAMEIELYDQRQVKREEHGRLMWRKDGSYVSDTQP